MEIQAGTTSWLGAQEHSRGNIGETETHVIFIELKEADRSVLGTGTVALGPQGG